MELLAKWQKRGWDRKEEQAKNTANKRNERAREGNNEREQVRE